MHRCRLLIRRINPDPEHLNLLPDAANAGHTEELQNLRQYPGSPLATTKAKRTRYLLLLDAHVAANVILSSGLRISKSPL
jgi:hypothetical protein